jgi:hypothetical protein
MQKALCWHLWYGLGESAFGGSLESGGRFCIGSLGRNLVPVAVIFFTFNLLYKYIFLYFCLQNVVVEWSTLCFVFGRSRVQISAFATMYPDFLRGFLQSLQANAGMLP